MSHVDDDLAEFEREIEELAQGSAAATPHAAEATAAAAESTTPRAVSSSHMFISSAHAYAPPTLNPPVAAAAAETSKPAYQP